MFAALLLNCMFSLNVYYVDFMAAIRNLEDAIASNAQQAEDIIQQILQLSPSNDNGKDISGGYVALTVILALFVITMIICSSLLVCFVLSRHRSKRQYSYALSNNKNGFIHFFLFLF